MFEVTISFLASDSIVLKDVLRVSTFLTFLVIYTEKEILTYSMSDIEGFSFYCP